ncbi:hypothetical protein KP509_14G061700 [Ceratopteris richardii]|nr:hypothetical protein KP509_14G061700 [Ceratopteris richardii]
MVTNVQDRWERKGNCIFGSFSWFKLCNLLDLSDMSCNSGFSWSNKQVGVNYRAARLDRCYASTEFAQDCWDISSKIDHSLLVSDHKPLLLTFRKGTPNYRSGRPHIDYSLLKIPSILARTKDIITHYFKVDSSPSAAWEHAVYGIQRLFTAYRKHALELRTQRRLALMDQLNAFDVNSKEYFDCSVRLSKERYLEARSSLAISREFWSENMDRNNKHMFALMKKRKVRDFVPPIKKSDGSVTSNMEETLQEAKRFFMDVFSVSPKWGEDIQRARATIALKRKKVLPECLVSILDLPLTGGEIKETINKLKPGKSPGMDGLPNEFFIILKDFLTPYILLIWEEVSSKGYLPCSINTGVIKLIHKRGPKDDLNNWRPITCLNTIYKIFAATLARRLSPLMNKLILPEQKGFIKGRFILDAIISLWEGMDFAKDSGQDYYFFKIDFDKAYDRIEWDFVLQSLHDLGLGRRFIKFVSTLFGNAFSRVSMNGHMSEPFKLTRSIRQGCPLAPLLFAIASDALGWLVKDALTEGKINGVSIPNSPTPLCLQMFADDTNVVLKNDNQSLTKFLDCLDVFYLASGSRVNHSKTGFKASDNSVPVIIAQLGCSIIKEGVIFRLLGIPMGFNVTFGQRWDWVCDKFKKGLAVWYDSNSSLPHRSFILNHYLLPKLVYFLSCWTPSKKLLNQVISMAKRFLWGGSANRKKIAKVPWDICCMNKEKGGLGLRCPKKMADILSAKWILRSIDNNEIWASLIQRSVNKFFLTNYRAWNNINLWDIITCPHPISPVGSPLVCRFWNSWFKAKSVFCPNDKMSFMAQYYLQESPWLGWLANRNNGNISIKEHKCHKKHGFKTWKDYMINGMRSDHDLVNSTNASAACLQVLLSHKEMIVDQLTQCNWKGINLHEVAEYIYKNFRKKKDSMDLVTSKLNRLWMLSWSSAQWSYRFKALWAYPESIKHSCLQWLIIHQGLWVGPRVRKIFIDGGKCAFCGRVEDVFHLFFDCFHAKPFWKCVDNFLNSRGAPKPQRMDAFIGCCKNMDILPWNTWRGHILWAIWLSRNNQIFGKGRKNFSIPLHHSLKRVSDNCIKRITKPSLPSHDIHCILATHHYTRWKVILSQLYSPCRFAMVASL